MRQSKLNQRCMGTERRGEGREGLAGGSEKKTKGTDTTPTRRSYTLQVEQRQDLWVWSQSIVANHRGDEKGSWEVRPVQSLETLGGKKRVHSGTQRGKNTFLVLTLSRNWGDEHSTGYR